MVSAADDLWTSDDGFFTSLDYAPTGRLLVGSCSNNTMYVLDPNRGTTIRTFVSPHKDCVSRVCFVGDYQFVSGSFDNSIGYWDIRSPTKAIAYLNGHKQSICGLSYLPETNTVISSSQDGHLRFWHLPTFAMSDPPYSLLKSMEEDEEGSLIRGCLTKCPNLSQSCFSESMGICANTGGNLFVINNIDIHSMKDDLKLIRFDSSTKFQLCWFTPNASVSKRNHIQLIEPDDYSPVKGANVSRVAHMSLHPTLPVALLRVTTTKHSFQSKNEIKDWTCVCSLREKELFQGNTVFNMSSFGSDVVDEKLISFIEEERYAPFRMKQPNFNLNGRIIASPEKYGVRLLALSSDLGTCDTPVPRKVPCPMDSFFSSGYWPDKISPLEVIARLPGPHNSVVCCKFSPVDDTLLAVGASNSQVTFYKPKL